MRRTHKQDRDNEFTEDIGTARLVAHARREITGGAQLLPKHVVDRLVQRKKSIRSLRNSRTAKR
jgi:hypothetical protein